VWEATVVSGAGDVSVAVIQANWLEWSGRLAYLAFRVAPTRRSLRDIDARKNWPGFANPRRAGSGERVLVRLRLWDLPDQRLLANARAKSCLDYFLTTPSNKVEPGRVFLTEGGLKMDGTKAEFVLQ
jgi:hypothetical protein